MVSFGFDPDSFTDFEWNSREYRQYIGNYIFESTHELERLYKIEQLYTKQTEYVVSLERQLTILQKTLDIAEKFSRPIVISAEKGE